MAPHRQRRYNLGRLSRLARILLGEDQLLIAEALKLLLIEHFEVVGIASDGRELVSETVRLKPDAVVLDISMPRLNGFEAARQIIDLVPTTKLLFLTQTADRAYVESAFALGASAYILKQAAASELVNALHTVLAGKTYLSPRLAR